MPPKNEGDGPVKEDAAPKVNPFDPLNFRVDPTGANPAGAEKILIRIPVDKPAKDVFFRTHPELKLTAPLLKMESERETYLLTPEVAVHLGGNVQTKTLTLYVTRASEVGLWPVPVPGKTRSSWTDSARVIAEQAEKEWCRMVSNQATGSYDLYKAKSLDVKPVWPELDMPKIIELAFGQNNVINTVDHPVVRGLLGQF